MQKNHLYNLLLPFYGDYLCKMFRPLQNIQFAAAKYDQL